MDENNSFINAYKKRALEQAQSGGEEAPAAEAAASGAPSDTMQYRMESGFTQPASPTPASAPAGNPVKRFAAYAAAGIILLLIVFGIVLLLNRGTELIDFTGWTENDAQLWARNNGILLQVEKEYNDVHEMGKVFAQHTAPGTRVRRGTFVRLNVSLGHDLSVRLPLPDIQSMNRDQIEQWAAENFMSRVRIAAEHSDTIPVGRVIRFEVNDPAVVDEVRRDSPIYIIISRGPQDAKEVVVTLPNFRSMTLQQIHAFAHEHGLVLKIEEAHDDYTPAGTIMSQSIKEGEKVPSGTEIVLHISLGKMIVIPNFAGESREMAAALANSLGVSIMMREEYSSASAGSFLYQSIAAGSVYQAGEILELVYSIDNKVVLPSFVGQTRDAIESWASTLNNKGTRINIHISYTMSASPPGTILAQDISNLLIGINTAVSITVSSGSEVFVPDFVGPEGAGYDLAVTREKALALCEALGIIPVFREEARAGRLPGEIWHQSIPAGSELTKGNTLVLKYVPNVQITIPNFIGRTQDEIVKAGFHRLLNIQYIVGTEPAAGGAAKVSAQSLRSGSRTASGSTITLTLPPEPAPSVLVPNFAGLTKDRALALAESLGIAARAADRYANVPAGVFVSQSIPPNTAYRARDVVELVYSMGNQITLPSFVGQTQDAMESWVNDMNRSGANITLFAAHTQNNAPRGTIIHQDRVNMRIGIHSTISITVSAGRVVFVPDLVYPGSDDYGYDAAITREKALAICEPLNIVPIFIPAAQPGRLPGEIWFQSLRAGTEFLEGSQLILKYVPADVQIVVPNFANLNHESIRALGYHKLLDIRYSGADVPDPAAIVTAQSVRAGSRAAQGSRITLTVTSGP